MVSASTNRKNKGMQLLQRPSAKRCALDEGPISLEAVGASAVEYRKRGIA